MKIKLPYISEKQFRNQIPDLHSNNERKLYWVGSVSIKSKENVDAFMQSAKEGNINKLKTFSQFGGDMLYAVIAESNKILLLCIISSLEDPSSSERCIFSNNIVNLDIEGYEEDSTGDEYFGKVQISTWDIIKAIFTKGK